MTRRRPLLLATGGLTAAALALSFVPAQAAAPQSGPLPRRGLVGAEAGGFPGAQVALGDRDNRGPRLAPLPGASAAVADLGSGVDVAWTRYGTVGSALRRSGMLATGLTGTPGEVARAFLRSHSALLGLSTAEVDRLQLAGDTKLGSSDGHAVRFQQVAGGVPLAEDGQAIVAVRGGGVAGLTSTLVGSGTLGSLNRTAPALTASQAVLAAAGDAGVGLSADDLTPKGVDAAGFTTVAAKGLAQPQRARLRALATTDRGTRLVWETDVLDVAGAEATAAVSFVDAESGQVLLRRDAVDNLAEGTRSSAGMRSIGLPQAAGPSANTFSGTYAATACSAKLPIDVSAGSKSLGVVAGAANPANDIVLNVFRNGKSVASSDTATSPEAAAVPLDPPATGTDKFTVQVCPFGTANSAPFDFAGAYTASDQGAPQVPPLPNQVVSDGSVGGPATFRSFLSNPTLPKPGLATATGASPDDRDLVCNTKPPASKNGMPLPDCRNNFSYTDASPLPYDVDATTGLPTLLTVGNNAATTNAQFSTSLTPGPPATPASSPTRDYTGGPFTDAWHQSSCDPTQTAGGANVDAAIVNLFTGHNRIHDFAYRLGLTETTGALQTNNFGKTGKDVAEGDPELGNTQNAAATNAIFGATNPATTPTTGLGLTGRNNANQITLQDGVPGITNQYLFEPVVGFYGPCTDGDLDASIYLHEYTHAITNRLIAGPATGLSGRQGGSMGESWSDLVAIEYLNAFGLAGKRGEDPFAEGAYATGDRQVGIRDYNLAPSKNPLTYAEFGFDTTGPEVHADGEIWNGVQMAVRQSLIEKYRSQADPNDKALQNQCALGHKVDGQPASTFAGCPGNRRWITYLFDSLILQANGKPSLVDMKNAMLMATKLAGNGSGVDEQTVADAYASRGLGVFSSSKDPAKKLDDSDVTDPTPSFASPTTANNAVVTFKLVDAVTGKDVAGKVFAGHYQARATPVAVTGTGGSPTTQFLGGRYSFVAQAPGFGLQRFDATFGAGKTTTTTVKLLRNVASKARGAVATGNGVRLGNVIDDNEATDGGFDGSANATPVAGRTVTVDLAGDLSSITKVAVSALHHPVDPNVAGDFQGRLLGVRAFDLQASKDGGKTYSTVYRSPDDFFPANRPRPVAPDLNLRTVTLPRAVTADHLRMVIRSTQCTGGADFNGTQKSAAAEIANGPSACKGSGANEFRATVTELQAFGTTAIRPATPPGGGSGPGGSGSGPGGNGSGGGGNGSGGGGNSPGGGSSSSGGSSGSGGSQSGGNGAADGSDGGGTALGSPGARLAATGADPLAAVGGLLLLSVAGVLARRRRTA